jgi:hypothetical protein
VRSILPLYNKLLNMPALKNYIGFFTILWFTWLQTAMFDLRFSTVSWVDRLSKVISFGVLIGMAMCGVLYDTSEVNWRAFKSLSIVLVVSRLSLALQYILVAYQAWKYKQARNVLLCTAGSLLGSTAIFVGLAFCFTDSASHSMLKAYYGW